MNSFGWIPALVAPVTTARAVPAAVTAVLKSQGLAPYPRTPMALPPTTYRSVIALAEGELRQRGIPFTPQQLHAELSSRQYQFQRTTLGFVPRVAYRPIITGISAPPPEVPDVPLPVRATAFLSPKNIPIAIAVVGGATLLWMLVKKTA